LYTFLISPMRATYPDNLIVLDYCHPNSIWWSIHVMKLLVMQSSPVSCHFLPMSKYSSQHPVLEHPNNFNLCASLIVRGQVSHPYKTGKIAFFFNF
jgi:hypothetical protein